MIVYHGNKDPHMVPKFGGGPSGNDYGSGFYMTQNKELAKEWAYCRYTRENTGWIHAYDLDTTDLRILELYRLDTLHWIAELLSHREVDFGDRQALEDRVRTIVDRYKLDTSSYDGMIGYRADDTYFRYAIDFVSAAIYLETMDLAITQGHLGLQVCIQSEKAFSHLQALHGYPERVPDKYRDLADQREKEATRMYRQFKTMRLEKQHTILDYLGQV